MIAVLRALLRPTPAPAPVVEPYVAHFTDDPFTTKARDLPSTTPSGYNDAPAPLPCEKSFTHERMVLSVSEADLPRVKAELRADGHWLMQSSPIRGGYTLTVMKNGLHS